MNNWIQDALWYALLVSIFVGGMLLWSIIGERDLKKGWARFYKHWPDMRGVYYIPAIIMLVFYAYESDAAEITYFNYAQIETGLEYQVGDKAFTTCYEGTFDKVGSNLGASVNFMEINKTFEINGRYTHHSCALERDFNVYDAVGIQLIWKIGR